MLNPRQPIGIFDSGAGGLTVVRAVRELLPHEDIVYLGDTARVPYGTKSAATVLRYSQICTQFLLNQEIKLLLIACNTATAFALTDLRLAVTIPVIGAVDPGARTAHAASRSGHIGVIGTLGTIRSGAYEKALRSLNHGAIVTGHACSLLVPLAEEGWTDGAEAALIARRYLSELAAKDPLIDTVVLGCTHYPLLVAVLAQAAASVFAHNVQLVDSASAMAQVARATLAGQAALREPTERGTLRCCVTDASRLEELAHRFLGEPLASYETVDL